ncbi:MAG: HD domain-containing protein [Candidatus Bathyarchaeia archaeon]
MRKYWGFIKDPLYGYIKITEVEKKIIDTTPVQRLRRIKQLSGAEYVYPAANHTRFEHSLGVMYLAGVLAQNLPIELNEESIEFIKLSALLHDVGHGPFSHVFDSILSKRLNETHEDLTSWIIKNSEIAEILEKESFSSKEASDLAVGKLNCKEPFFNQIISSGIDVDKMDFIPRDSYHTGAGYGSMDVFRLIYSMEIHEGNLTIGETALSALETFLLARLESFKTIYFHKASRAAQIMLVKALEKAENEAYNLPFNSVDEYLALDDYSVWFMLKKCEASKEIIKNLENRKLLKCAYERIFFTQEKMVTSIFTNEVVRRKIEEEIASKANLDYEKVVIDIPSLPSVPYANAKLELMDIPVFVKNKSGGKTSKKATELSRIINVMQAYMNIVRVYTEEQYRSKVAEASEKTFGYLPSETTISY